MANTYSAGGSRTTAVVIAIIILHLGFYWALKQGLVRAGMIWAASGAKDYKLVIATVDERLATGRVTGADLTRKLRLKATSEYSLRDYRGAAASFDKLAAQGALTADDLTLLATCQMQLKDYGRATGTLEKAIAANDKAGRGGKNAALLEMLNSAYFETKNDAKRILVLHRLMLVFGIWLRWLPVAGWMPGRPADLILPVVTLALPVIAYLARLTRGSLLETLRATWIRAARARGLPERTVILRHALPAALLPVVSYFGPAAAAVLAGSLVVETLFGLPGMGRHLVQGALNRDYTLVMGMVIFYAALLVLLNLVVDLLYGWLDPRIRHG